MVFFYKGWRKGCCACRITFLFFFFRSMFICRSSRRVLKGRREGYFG